MRPFTMLVISRRKGQRIAIGDDIEIVITEVHRSSVKVGIRAPRGYAVLRGEVSDAISEANREAAGVSVERALALAGSLPVGAAAATPPAIARQAADATASQSRDAAPVRALDGPPRVTASRPPPAEPLATKSGAP